MFRDYYACRAWLEGFIPQVYGKEELGLARIENLLKLLGNPQNKFKSVHVAGTSGKGSTAFYIARLLEFARGPVSTDTGPAGRFPRPTSSLVKDRTDLQISKPLAAGARRGSPAPVTRISGNYSAATPYQNSSHITHHTSLKVGLHLSPHLSYIGERMVINGNPIPVNRLIRLIGQIKPVVEKIKKEKPDLTPSYFEILVAASFLYFAQEKVDFAVVEVGLGGRLDATNVLTPEVSIITNIGLDHTDILGKTIEKIAREKAGIIKEGVPVITGTSGKALEVIEKVAGDKRAKLVKVSTQDRLLGNKLLALAAVEAAGIPLEFYSSSESSSGEVSAVSSRQARTIIDRVFSKNLPGRFEEIEPGVILDGAHNADKIRALIHWIKSSQRLTVNSQLILIVAFKKGKNWKKIVDLLLKNLLVQEVIATEFQAVTDTGRFGAVPAEEIAEYVKRKIRPTSPASELAGGRASNVKRITNSQEAVFGVLQSTDNSQQSTVLVTGSLYLVGEVRTIWQLPEF